MKFDSLFFRRDPVSRRSRHEPRFNGAVLSGLPALPEPEDHDEPLSTPFYGAARTNFSKDPRHMSPRQLAAWAHDLYICRVLSWEEYCMAGFPAELHPHYNRTVGALTGAVAQPDAPRDMIRVWEERRAFVLRYFAADEPEVLRTEKLLHLLRQDAPVRV